MNKNRAIDIKIQIEKLQKELDAIEKEAKSLEFVKLLREVLLNKKCSIGLSGHDEWQFNESYHIKDISYNIRKEILEVLDKIVDEVENGDG